MTDTHKGQCFCGAVELEVSGAPEGMGYCHCDFMPFLVSRAGQRIHPMEA